MPRRPRVDFEGALQHVVNRGVDRAGIVRGDGDRRLLLALLAETAATFLWDVLAHSLMTNHLHLLLRTRAATLSAGMQYLEGTYARLFNARHDRTGPLFEGRFHSRPIHDDAYLNTVVRYIAWNPVEAGICTHPSEHPWSSHGTPALLDLLGGRAAYDRLIALGPTTPPRARDLKVILTSEPRPLAVATARAEGYTVNEIAAALGVHRSSVYRLLPDATAGSDPLVACDHIVRPRISFMISSLPPPIGPRRASRRARSMPSAPE